MSSGEKSGGDPFDVVLLHGKTEDGAGALVLRARPGRLEAGEVRPLQSGRPLVAGAEVVRLAPRGSTPNLYDVKVEYQAPGDADDKPTPAALVAGGPAQVATRAYRDSWDRTFGPGRRKALAN